MHYRSTLSLCRRFFCTHPLHRSPFPSKPQLIPNPQIALLKPPNPPTHLAIFNNTRPYSVEIDKEVDEINLKFAEAREEIESAMDSKETVYFNEEAECARQAVNEVVQMYEHLLNKLSQNEKGLIQRSMGLKIHQLKAELDQLND